MEVSFRTEASCWGTSGPAGRVAGGLVGDGSGVGPLTS